jgi:hypothetical protein
MFISTDNQNLGNYYYRPSMTLGATITQTNPSGKTVQDFLPADWYSSAVYRNILDMINTLMVIRKKLLGAAYGRFVNPYNAYWTNPSVVNEYSILSPYSGAGYRSIQVMTDDGPETKRIRGENNADLQAFWGYAAKKIGDHKNWTVPAFIKTHIFGNKTGTMGAPQYPAVQIPQVVSIMKWSGYRLDGKTWKDNAHNKRIMAGGGYSTIDLVSLVRSLDWEMNRVHMPMPSNLRQWAAIYNQLAYESSYISWYERIVQLKRLGAWLVVMKEKTRAAIAASNLTYKVAEESLVLENADIVKRNAQEQARLETERLKQIETERIAAQQFIEAEKIRLADEAVAAEKARIAAASRAQAQAALQTAYSPDGVLITAPPIVSAPPPIVSSAPPTITQATPYTTPVITRPPKPGAGIVPLLATGAAAFFLF